MSGRAILKNEQYLCIFNVNRSAPEQNTFKGKKIMKFVSCFIIGLLLLCISTLSLVSCLPILSTTALLDDYAFRFYFSISLFGFGCGWYFLAIARV